MWGMERGGLVGTIPTEIGLLSNLIFIDLDFNDLTGTLSSELLSLSSLNQLDVNDNRLSGSINGIGNFLEMEFLQLHRNLFTGTVPVAVGNFSNLFAFTLHGTSIGGTMPEEVCNLLATRGNGGILGSLIADCIEPTPDIVCTCCTSCRGP
jgi:Leucine-rich repeat (LRR) protein